MNIAEKLLTIAQNQQAVYDAGKQAEYDRFWDSLQQNGERTEYVYAFTNWDDESFTPKYDIRPTGSIERMFYHYKGAEGLINMINKGLVFDTSGATSGNAAFSCDMERIPAVSTVGMASLGSLFAYAQKVHTIDKVILRADGSQSFASTTFSQCYALQNLVIEGTIGQNGFLVSNSTKLTVDSLMSIINALKNYANSGTTHTVTLGTTNLNKLTDAQKAIATQKGWTLA